MRRSLYDPCRQRSNRFHQMFAGIENQKNPSALQKCNETRRCIVRLNRLPQHGGDGRRCELRISQHPEIDEEDRTREGVHQVMCNGDRDRRLADATSADDGDKARSGQVSRQLQDIIIPSDNSAQGGREGWRTENWQRRQAPPRARCFHARQARRSNSPVRRGS